MKNYFLSKKINNILSITFILLILCLSAIISIQSKAEEELDAFEIKDQYKSYIEQFRDKEEPDYTTIIQAIDYVNSSKKTEVEIVDNLAGFDGKCIKTGEEGYLEYQFILPEAGLYNVAIKYYPLPGRGGDIQRGLWVNGKIPFIGVEYAAFKRLWKDSGQIRRDNRGNEIAPDQKEAPAWREEAFRDPLGYYNKPYQIYFKKGKNTIRILSQREPAALAYIKIYQEKDRPGYQEIREEYEQKGYQPVKEHLMKIQAENPSLKSSSTIIPLFDRSDPLVEPYHHSLIRLNTIGSYRWQDLGDWLQWEFEAPEDGLYKLAFKAKQNYRRGMFINRKLKIDGMIPFQEMESVEFYYSSQYQMKVPRDPESGEIYLFYLTEGKHTLSLEVSLGDLATHLRTTEDILIKLNNIFRQILMITSATPDPLRDYQLSKRIPEVIHNLDLQADRMNTLAGKMEEYTGEKGGHVALLNDISREFKIMTADPDKIPEMIPRFRDHIGSLGNWILNTTAQPLRLDYVIVAAPDEELPPVKPNSFQTALHEAKAFGASFYVNYEMVGDVYDKSEEKEPLTVWLSVGRDRAQVLKKMIEDTFTPETGIYVNLELVNLGTLLPATLAGRGPDVAIGTHAAAPVNFWLRDAVEELNDYPGIGEVIEQFHPSAMAPFTYKEDIFAIPQRQVFPVMFYRKDILKELEQPVPQTWEDVVQLIPELQKNNMNFGLPISDVQRRRRASVNIGETAAGSGSLSAYPGVQPFLIFLYQRGEQLYLPEAVATSLDSEEAVEAFRFWCDLYELYDLPVQYSPHNRFRLGEIPVMIGNYTIYNMLQVFAPELRGLWDFTLVPGTRREDGTIDWTIPAGALRERNGAANMIMKASDQKEEAWQFLKWFSSTEAQLRYGREIENIIGVAARQPTANIEAQSLLPWTPGEYSKLDEQRQYLRGVPEVPGGYMTGRHLDNAWRKVVYDQAEARKTLLDYVRVINEAIETKRSEFGLETDVDKVLKKYE